MTTLVENSEAQPLFYKYVVYNNPKVIIEKSRGEVSLMDQDTIENVS